MSADKRLDLTISDLILIGQYGRFSILYQPALDRWHGVIPAQGQSTDRLEKAQAAYFSDINRDDLIRKLDKHKTEEFQRFRVLKAPEFLPKEESLFKPERQFTATVYEVTSQASEQEFWFREENSGTRSKQYLSGYFAETPENLGVMAEMTAIAREAVVLHKRYTALRNKLTKAELPVSEIDRLLNTNNAL